MILSNFTHLLYHRRFASRNKSLSERVRKISARFLGTYGIHMIKFSDSKKKIKIFINNNRELDLRVKKSIQKIAGKTQIVYIEKKVHNPENYHLEKIFDCD